MIKLPRNCFILLSFLLLNGLLFSSSAQSDETGVKFNIKETLVVELKPQPARATTTQFDYLPWGYHLSWSPDMKRVVYWVANSKGMFLVADGVAGKPFNVTDDGSPRGGLEPPTVTFTHDSRHFVYAAKRGKKTFVVYDGKESKPYDAIRDFCFSPDSNHYAFVAKRGSQFLVVRDGVEGKPYSWIATKDLHFSSDSKRLAYWAKRGTKNYIILVEGNSTKETPFNPRLRQASPPKPSEHQKSNMVRGKVQSVIREGKDALIVNGIESRPYSYVSPETVAFSPDGKHFAFSAMRDGDGFLVVDGVELQQTYDDVTGLVTPPIVFDGPKTLHTLALRNQQIYRVEIEIIIP